MSWNGHPVIEQVAKRPSLAERAKQKILAENANAPVPAAARMSEWERVS